LTLSQIETATNADRWAVVLGASVGSGAAIARSLAADTGHHIFGVHRGKHPEEAKLLEQELLSTGRSVVIHVGDAGTAEGAADCAEALLEVAGPRSVGTFVHSIAAASLGHFLSDRGDALHPRQFEKTFDYMAHSFAYWGQVLYERDLLAPNAQLLGLTNSLHDSLLHNCGLIAASKAALEMYVRHLALELGPKGHRVNLLKFATVVTPALRVMLGPEAIKNVDAAHRQMIPAGRMCTLEEVGRFVSLLTRKEAAWINGATIDFTGGVALRLLDLILKPA
jgi:NAD(P)-dependent dehydrogenase (short-subunit alcohol dehydrogenase family)